MRRPAWMVAASLSLAPAAAPGADQGETCVEPYIDIFGRVALEARGRLDFARVADLDGDRHRDILVWDAGTCGSGGCDVHIYLTNRGCPRWAGWIRGVPPVALRSRHAGVRDLGTHENGGAQSWTESVAEYDGREYRVRERDCTQPADSATPRCSDFRPRSERAPRVPLPQTDPRWVPQKVQYEDCSIIMSARTVGGSPSGRTWSRQALAVAIPVRIQTGLRRLPARRAPCPHFPRTPRATGRGPVRN